MSAISSFFDALAFVIATNRRRLVVLLAFLGLVIAMVGAANLFTGVGGFLGNLPAMMLQLMFIAFAGIAQFAALMYFLSRPRKYVVTPDSPQIGLSFADYRGQPDLLEHAKSLTRILRGVARFRAMGGEPPKGMLLAGSPGTGKSFLAGVIAAEANLPFLYVDASSLTSMWFGMDALIVVQLFGQARKLARQYAPPGEAGAAILFIDELDSVGQSRGGMGGGQMAGGMGAGGLMGGFRGMALNTMLNQMDSLGQHVEDRRSRKMLRWLGFIRGPVPTKPVVFVIGATNRPDVLDPALIRPGRLDRRLNVYPPDAEGRRDILLHYLSKKSHSADLDIDLMVSDSINWTPIDIKTIINEALIVAHDEGRDELTYRDWLTARDHRQLGLKQPITTMLPEDRRAIAYHEAGHAVAARYLQQQNRIQKASIIRMGDALGLVQRSPKEERHTRHAREIETDIMVSLGSRAVEEVFLKTKMTGAGSDLDTATLLATWYVADLGMGSTLLAMRPTAMGVPAPLLRQVDELLDQLFEETKRLVTEKAYAVDAVAAGLMDRGELIGPELEEIFIRADAANLERSAPFERKIVHLRKAFARDDERETQPVSLVPATTEESAAARLPLPPVTAAAMAATTRRRAVRWRPEDG